MTLFYNYPPSRNDPMDAHNDQDGVGLPTKYPVFRITIDPTFTREQREWIAKGIAAMSRIGFTGVFVNEFVPGPRRVLYRHWPDDNSTNPVEKPRGKDAGMTVSKDDGSKEVWLDPAGLEGERQWSEASAHEFGHVAGIKKHVDGRAPAIMRSTLYGLSYSKDLSVDPANQLGGTLGPEFPTQGDFDAYDEAMAELVASSR
ncbi:MAG: hypothetical protein ABI652_07900 [Acidobacteriota bacterium]